MERKIKSTFNKYRKLSKRRSEIDKEMETLRAPLVAALKNDALVDDNGEILLQMSKSKSMWFDEESFAMLYPDLHAQFCVERTTQRLLIKQRLK